MNRQYAYAGVVALVVFGWAFLGGWNAKQEYVGRMLSLEPRSEQQTSRRNRRREKAFDGEIAKMQEWMAFFSEDEIAAFEDYVKFRPPLKTQSKEDYVKQFKEYRKWVESR